MKDRIFVSTAGGVIASSDVDYYVDKVHYVILSNGLIHQATPEDKAVRFNCESRLQERAVFILISNSELGGSWPISNAALKSLAGLIETVSQRYRFPTLNYGEEAKFNLITPDVVSAVGYHVTDLKKKIPELLEYANKGRIRPYKCEVNEKPHAENQYWVRKSWTDMKSELGPFAGLNHAHMVADKRNDYLVFDNNGNIR